MSGIISSNDPQQFKSCLEAVVAWFDSVLVGCLATNHVGAGAESIVMYDWVQGHYYYYYDGCGRVCCACLRLSSFILCQILLRLIIYQTLWQIFVCTRPLCFPVVVVVVVVHSWNTVLWLWDRHKSFLPPYWRIMHHMIYIRCQRAMAMQETVCSLCYGRQEVKVDGCWDI